MKLFMKEIDLKKKEAIEAAGGDKKKMDFDEKRDCYMECLDVEYDLEPLKRDKQGNVLEQSIQVIKINLWISKQIVKKIIIF